jgi:hypothetical protein
MEDVTAYKLTATKGDATMTQYVAPDSRRYAAKLLQEEGYTVTEEALTELPEGVELDVD